MDGFFELDPTISAQDLEFYELHLQPDSFWVNSNLGVFQLSLKGEIITYLPVHCYSMGFTPDGKLMETNPYAGVRIYDNPENFTFRYFHPDLPTTPLQIAKVATDKGKTYLASVFHGFYHWDGEKFVSYLKDGIWEEEKFKSLHVLENGEVLVGTEFGELYRIQTEPSFKILQKWTNEELRGTSILALESYESTIIVVTERGIHLLDNEKNRFLDEEQGFYEKVFLSSERVGDQLFLGTTTGFYTINLEKLTQTTAQSIQLGITELKINHRPVDPDYFDWFIYRPEKN